jgi:hypothetical protein
MIVEFRVGWNRYESLDLDESQIKSLLNYLLNNTVTNEAVFYSFKLKNRLDEDYIDDFKYRSYMQK